jgi:hypothetical protein
MKNVALEYPFLPVSQFIRESNHYVIASYSSVISGHYFKTFTHSNKHLSLISLLQAQQEERALCLNTGIKGQFYWGARKNKVR